MLTSHAKVECLALLLESCISRIQGRLQHDVPVAAQAAAAAVAEVVAAALKQHLTAHSFSGTWQGTLLTHGQTDSI